VVERDGLENRCTGNRTVGSNPTLSARRPNNLNKIKGRWGVTHTMAFGAGEGRPRGLALVEEMASAASPRALDPPLSRASAL
jgi:hypothetical protein